ncbi:MAG: 50S ribosomal protein L29 [Spiroplasma sp.]|nr:50S ribosomal protein L29 [Spiroplasma sp.]
MEMQVIKSKKTIELQEHEENLRAQLFALRIQKAIGKLDTPHMINQLRKDIARIKTELKTRALNGEIIKPLNIQKMTLPEEKTKDKTKKAQKSKSTSKEDKEIKVVDKKPTTKTKIASEKEATKETKVKPKEIKKTATKTTKSSSKEDKNNDK